MTGVTIFSFMRLIEKSSIQTNQTRTFINLYGKDTDVEYNLSQSNLELGFGLMVPSYVDLDELPLYFKIVGQWYDNTLEELENSSNTINPMVYSFDLKECANDAFDDFLGENGMDNLPQNGKYYCFNHNDFVLKSYNRTYRKRHFNINLMR